VAQGYLKMVLDGRLPGAAEQQRALEHTRDAVGRIGALSREASDLASWLERPESPRALWRALSARSLLDAALARAGQDAVDTSLLSLDSAVTIRTCDEAALTTALVSLIVATIREAPQTRLSLCASVSDGAHVDFVVGAPESTPALLQGPSAPDAAGIALERGGLGLSLVMTLLVLDTHGATVWTTRAQRAAAAVRLPLEGFPS
jgi:hypothetical protein